MSKSTGTLSSVVGSGCDAEALATADPMMLESAASVDTSQLDFEVWRAFLRSNCGDQPEVADPNAFASWVRRFSVYGLPAAAIRIECGCAATHDGRNLYRSERTQRDVRRAGADYYYAIFQLAGRAAERLRCVCCSTSLEGLTKMADRRSLQLTLTCSWQSTISLAHDLRRAIRRLSHAMRTSCLRVSAASSGMASPIRIS